MRAISIRVIRGLDKEAQVPDCQRLDATPLHANHYADGAAFVSAPIIENVQLARDTYRLRFEAPAIADVITPGQFVMVRVAGIDDPLLGRAFALYDTSDDRTTVDVVYLVHGKLTALLATRQPGDLVEVWGPLGNGFTGSRLAGDIEALDHLILVAGGIGYTPFLAAGREALAQKTYGAPSRSRLSASRVTFCYGVRTAAYVAGEQDFRAAGFDLRIASNDGSIGHNGLVTDLLQQALSETTGPSRRVLCCGPEPMMHAVAEVCLASGVRCDVSLETPMACGLGVCFSCVAKVRQPDGEWDYKRTCVEGPVFDASLIEW
ncbi:dihydroorotate dehydrogenase electron transfer subunit [Botrimarina mediterranea]|uniref:Dihydroorotate dehydrogenase B (NAD(+)), electron transfer subunit n=1 Tax=Botrimarina mediterranea TaxID=2528022 RepID=A0A518KAW6_9BACT|nr:Dihydroorotate dehydrogenase B (NAD(+)), electron transfer subunit [Botrimarina mediterranea]QDV79576.1 Dihydroorotate dehydrogenase B (NAD(+)), electron transfer subunit [Planctomycetes bacterium K2D]